MKQPIKGLYILEGKKVIPCIDPLRWAVWLREKKQPIGRTVEGDIMVSTVFLGADLGASLAGKPPCLFETRVFGGPLDDHNKRYYSWEGAEEGHKTMCKKVFGKEVVKCQET